MKIVGKASFSIKAGKCTSGGFKEPKAETFLRVDSAVAESRQFVYVLQISEADQQAEARQYVMEILKEEAKAKGYDCFSIGVLEDEWDGYPSALGDY